MAGVAELSKNYEKGIEYYDQGLLLDALAEFEKLLSEAPEGSVEAKLARFYVGETHARLAQENLNRGARERAEEHLREAIARNPKYPDLHYQLAEIIADGGTIHEAMVELETALKLNPDYAKALLLLGILCYGIGDYDTGAGHIARAAEIEHRYQTPAYVEAMAAHSKGDRRGALALLQDLALTNVDDISFHFGVGKKHYRAGEYKEAVEAFEQALSLEPTYPDIRDWLGMALMAGGNHERALEEFLNALQTNPNYTHAIINAGVACEMLGYHDDAAAFYERALGVDPDNLEARERLSNLRR